MRSPRRLLPWALAAALLALLAAAAPWRSSAPDHPQLADPNHWERLDADEPAPGFALTDARGRRVALADFRGRVAILTFLYTHCTDVCPVLPQILSTGADNVPLDLRAAGQLAPLAGGARYRHRPGAARRRNAHR
jgi:cytochrome oxidase Cu insertion factor (SCO1/SenC/PrrC family)